MKRPTSSQLFFAQDWPLKLSMAAGTLIAFGVTAAQCEPTKAILTDWRASLTLLVALAVASLMGFLIACLFAAFFLAPVYRFRARSNGAPFAKDDLVQILVGPNKGKITRIYANWQGDTFRVILGKIEHETFKDIFSPTQLLREDPAVEHELPAYAVPDSVSDK